jgi:hypothetical protein
VARFTNVTLHKDGERRSLGNIERPPVSDVRPS